MMQLSSGFETSGLAGESKMLGALNAHGVARSKISFSKFITAIVFLLAVFCITPSPAEAQIFDADNGSGSGWVQMFRGNGAGPIADPGSSMQYAAALRNALGIYSNALLIVASVILLYHLLVMTGETAHQGVIGGKRTNQVWAPIRLVIAIGLLVPLASGLNSAQYITLQVIEWGSNMASRVWWAFLDQAGSGAGTSPTPHMPDVGAIAREAAKIGACMHLINLNASKTSGGAKNMITRRGYGPAILYGTEKYEALCGSVIIFAMGPGAAAGVAGIEQIIQQMQSYAPKFLQGTSEYNQDPGPAPAMGLALALGTLESVSGGWNSGAGSAGAGWVEAGSYFLELAAGGSNRVSGTDTLPIITGPKSELIRPEPVQQAFFKMAEWIVGKYTSHISGGGAVSNMIGNTVAGRKFVDLLLLFMDQLGVVSGLWSPGSVAFYIDLGNSPLAELVDLGHRMIRTALDCVGAAVDLGVNEPQHAMYSSQVASKESKAFGPKAGLFWAQMAIPVLSAFASALMSMGILIGIFTPMLPFMKFVLSVMTWLALVVESLVCAPLIALAYLTPYGEGFGGQKVEPSYHIIIHTFLRPVMTIFGLIASILLFNIAAHLVTTFYQAITSSAGAFKGGMYVVAKVAFGNMYVSMLYTCLNMSLKVMDTFAKHATRWIGGNTHEENMGDAAQTITVAEKGSAMMSSFAGSLGGAALSAGMQMSGHTPSGGGGGRSGQAGNNARSMTAPRGPTPSSTVTPTSATPSVAPPPSAPTIAPTPPSLTRPAPTSADHDAVVKGAPRNHSPDIIDLATKARAASPDKVKFDEAWASLGNQITSPAMAAHVTNAINTAISANGDHMNAALAALNGYRPP
ncbi:MAG: DotA/TraY family protein [Alphaproteobacteria bacterium]|nr:DotA/TraY family protein [Alphaproteobacteria bacterium]